MAVRGIGAILKPLPGSGEPGGEATLTTEVSTELDLEGPLLDHTCAKLVIIGTILNIPDGSGLSWSESPPSETREMELGDPGLVGSPWKEVRGWSIRGGRPFSGSPGA